MCRHLAYLGPPTSLERVVIAPEHGLYTQSWAPRLQKHGVVNADGFGVGWYPADPGDPSDQGELREANGAGEPHTGHTTYAAYAGDAARTARAGNATYRTQAGDAAHTARAGDAAYRTQAGDAAHTARAGDAAYPAYAGDAARADRTTQAGHPTHAADPARYRRNVPIWTDANLPEMAKAIRSHAIIAAVRSATPGTGQDESAAAPFRDGRFLFSHNGVIPDWTNLPTDLTSGEALSLPARSDSALLWLLIYRELRRGVAPERALSSVVAHVAAVRPTARLNVLLTDGRSIVATRFGDTLWYRTGPDLLVASEPDDEAVGEWHEVPDRTLLLADQAGVVRTTSLHASYAAAEK